MRFTLPDAVLGRTLDVDSAGFWMSHETPRESVFLSVKGVGSFVRSLVEVQLTGGFTVTYGAWIELSPDDAQHAFEIWFAPSYVDLELDGRLANSIAPWDVWDAPVHLAVRDPQATPYCVSSPDPAMSNLLNDVWPHELVLSSLPD